MSKEAATPSTFIPDEYQTNYNLFDDIIFSPIQESSQILSPNISPEIDVNPLLSQDLP